MSKKVLYMLLTLALVVGLSSWYLVAQAQDKNEQNAAGKNITVTGCLAKGESPKEFHLTSDDGKRYELRSDSVSLSDHVGHKVTVKGTTGKESEAEERGENEKNEARQKNEAGENNAANLQVTDLQMVSNTCK